MAEKKTQEYARWMQKDGETRLIAAENLDTARGEGWAEPTGVRGNGEPWNPPVREGAGLPQAESAAVTTQATEELRQKLADEDNAKALEQQAAIDKARAERGPTPDLTVAVVDQPKATSDSAAKKSTATKSAK